MTHLSSPDLGSHCTQDKVVPSDTSFYPHTLPSSSIKIPFFPPCPYFFRSRYCSCFVISEAEVVTMSYTCRSHGGKEMNRHTKLRGEYLMRSDHLDTREKAEDGYYLFPCCLLACLRNVLRLVAYISTVKTFPVFTCREMAGLVSFSDLRKSRPEEPVPSETFCVQHGKD